VDGFQSRPECCDIELPAPAGNWTPTADSSFFLKRPLLRLLLLFVCFFLGYLFIFYASHNAFNFLKYGVEYYDGQC